MLPAFPGRITLGFSWLTAAGAKKTQRWSGDYVHALLRTDQVVKVGKKINVRAKS